MLFILRCTANSGTVKKKHHTGTEPASNTSYRLIENEIRYGKIIYNKSVTGTLSLNP
jgi:hypothetical protein